MFYRFFAGNYYIIFKHQNTTCVGKMVRCKFCGMETGEEIYCIFCGEKVSQDEDSEEIDEDEDDEEDDDT